MKTKNKILGLLAGIACVTLGAGVGASVMASANTDMTIGGKSAASFRMSYGAGVRFNQDDPTDNKLGIRFSATLNKSEYTELEKLEGDVNYGMIIVPEDIAATNPLTKENLFGTAATYCLKTPKSADEENGCECTKQHAASVEYATLATVKDNDSVMQLRGSLVDIKTGNLTREFVGLGYIEFGDEYVLAQPAYYEDNAENDANVDYNTRSMTHVAQLAIEDEQDDENNTLYNAYVKTFIDNNTQFKYTVKHHLPNDSGAYDVYEETLYASLDAEVSATHVKEGNVKDVDGSAYRLHEISTSLGNASGKVYASGRTVLNAYYAPIDTSFNTVINDDDEFLMAANNYYKESKGISATWLDDTSQAGLNGDTKYGVVKIDTTEADQYTAGKFYMALGANEFEKAVANDWAFIKLHMYIDADNNYTKINFLSFNQTVASNVETEKWVDVIVPLAKMNQSGTFLRSLGGVYTEANCNDQLKSIYGYTTSRGEFLCTNTIKENTKGYSTDVTYYIDEVSWGIDTKAPVISLTDVAEKMYEGTFTEPTVTVTDDLALQSRLDSTVETKLYKVEGETRTEVTLTDNAATLTEGTYEYVVTADDRIYTDVVGNVATETRTFTVEKRQDFTLTFDSADDVRYIQKHTGKNYEATTRYLTEEEWKAELAANNSIEASEIAPVGGVIKFVAGMEDAKGADGQAGTDGVPDAMYGAWLKLVLSAEEIAETNGATSVTFRMLIHPSSYPSWTGQYGEVDLIDGGSQKDITGCDRNTWVDVTVSVSDLAKSLNSYLDGTTPFFWTNSDTMYDAKGTITYYINSITFDVTP